MNFAYAHIATLFKYGGISFIAGAVNHGFFSEARSIWTASFGVLFYIFGSWLDLRNRNRDMQKMNWGDVVGFGLVASIGLGFFTGGLQHFPDSPDRSLWVVPLGFLLSMLAMYFMDWRSYLSVRSLITYGLVAFAVVVTGAAIGWSVLQDSSPSSVVATRTITITLNDDMRFSPTHWQATSGETVRIQLVNAGKVRHEFVIGTEAELLAHAQEMKQANGAHHHHASNAVSLGGGESGELMWTFTDAGVLQIACFEPGHYEAGMRGTISVLP